MTLHLYEPYLLRKLSSEKGLDGRRTLDRPRSTFHEGDEARSSDDEDGLLRSFDLRRLPLRSRRLPDLRGECFALGFVSVVMVE